MRITEHARDLRNRYYHDGIKAYDAERYFEARKHFLTVLQYDEYYAYARTMANLASSAMDTTIAIYLREGRAHEDGGNHLEAIKMYSQVLLAYPHHHVAKERLREVRSKLLEQQKKLIATGDSLRDIKKFDRARKTYKHVLDINPDNQEVCSRLAEMEAMIKKNVQSHLARARMYLQEKRIEEAWREYQEVLGFEPKNAVAKAGLESLEARRTTKDLFERGISAFDEGGYFKALMIFLEVLNSDEKHRDAKIYLDMTREILLPEVEDFFKRGLKLYVKEDYQAALEAWNKALLIQSNHQTTVEYSRRAKSKLEALEKLQ